MQLICSKCGVQIKSLVIPESEGFKDVLNRSYLHVKNKHPEMVNAMQQAVTISIASLTNFMHLSEFFVITDNQVFIRKAMEQWQEIIMAAIGFDVEDEEGEGEDLEGEEIVEEIPELPPPSEEEDKTDLSTNP